MAKLDGTIQFTGSLQNLSFYKMRGSDKIIVRKKGGPSRKQVKHSPNFENTRHNNSEFGGRALAAATIKSFLYPLLFLADYNIVGPLNALLCAIQKMDTENTRGKRHVLLTKQPRLLEGFYLNRRYLLETIVRTPVACSLQGEQVSIDLPALIPGINFMPPGNYPYYRFIVTGGLVPDVYYTDYGYRPTYERKPYSGYIESEWLTVNAPSPALTLTLNGMPEEKPIDGSIMIGLGIAFGQIQGDTIMPEKYVGAAKVLMVV
jgi:hypothetical protein